MLRICPVCEQPFNVRSRGRKFCSATCRNAAAPTLEDRFWAKVDKGADCWEWSAHRMPNGYGIINIDSSPRLAHRTAWELAYGAIPDELWVLHRCDNPACVRPDHLFLGTAKDNMQDMHQKGRNAAKVCPERQARGDRHMSRTKPETLKRGDEHYTRLHPEKVRRGEASNKARFSEQDIRDMRQQYEQGVSMRELARRYNAARKSIQAIVQRRTWKHIE